MGPRAEHFEADDPAVAGSLPRGHSGARTVDSIQAGSSLRSRITVSA